jgi:hypothetical protein
MSKLLYGFIGLGFAALGAGLGAPAFADGLPGMRGTITPASPFPTWIRQ